MRAGRITECQAPWQFCRYECQSPALSAEVADVRPKNLSEIRKASRWCGLFAQSVQRFKDIVRFVSRKLWDHAQAGVDRKGIRRRYHLRMSITVFADDHMQRVHVDVYSGRLHL